MSLRRRIALAAAVAVAAVAVAISVVGYVSTRSHLIGEHQGRASGSGPRASAAWPRTCTRWGRRPRPGGAPQERADDQFNYPPNPRFGGATGYFQVVHPDGTTDIRRVDAVRPPIDARVLEIARSAHGSFFTTTTLNGVHLEVLSGRGPADHHAIQVALPLTGVDSVLDGLLLPYGLLIGGGSCWRYCWASSSPAPHSRRSRVSCAAPRRWQASLTGRAGSRRPEPMRSGAWPRPSTRTLEALERSIEAQRHLVADASHELRTPMAALRTISRSFWIRPLPAAERGAAALDHRRA